MYQDIRYKTIIINLKRRPDRKTKIEAQLKTNGFTDDKYSFMDAVDGTQLNITPEIYELFKGNDFNYRIGVIGCAMSHIALWKQLIHDSTCDCYVILEDDSEFVENFELKLNKAVDLFNHNPHAELCLISTNFLNRIKSPCTNVECMQVVKKNNYEVEGTGGYIISKRGAAHFIAHYTACPMTRSIDASLIDNFNEQIYETNEYLIKSPNTSDTDVQNNSQSLCNNFNNQDTSITPNCPTTMTVAFCDWWKDEYGGGEFNVNDNFFVNILKMYSGAEIKIVEPSQTPDILFYSIFGYNSSRYSARRKVFFSGESVPHRTDADFNITFDASNAINTRLPLWVCCLDETVLKESLRRMDCNPVSAIMKREKFCSYIATQSGFENNRERFVKMLSSNYKRVDCGGRHLNNIGGVVPLGINASGKIEHNKQYKFAIAFENKQYDGYVTEKIHDAYKSGCIPIYWGTPDVVRDFNPSTFINANDFPNFDALIEHIRRVDCDHELYASYFKEPILSDAWMQIFTDPTHAFFKKLASDISNSAVSFSRLNLWTNFWCNRDPSKEAHDDANITMKHSISILQNENINDLEDWGCGNCVFKKYCEKLEHIKYIGIDGSNTGYQDKIADLTKYKSDVDCIYIRHILEHNDEYEKILKNGLQSFKKVLILILFTPLLINSNSTQVIDSIELSGHTIPDIAFKENDITDIIEKNNCSYEKIEVSNTKTKYRVETIFIVKHK